MAKTKSVSKSQKPKRVKEKPEVKVPKCIDIGKNNGSEKGKVDR